MIAEFDCHYFHLLLCFCFLPVDCVDFQLLILLTVNVSTVALAFVRFSPSLLLLLPPNLFNTCFVRRVFLHLNGPKKARKISVGTILHTETCNT